MNFFFGLKILRRKKKKKNPNLVKINLVKKNFENKFEP